MSQLIIIMTALVVTAAAITFVFLLLSHLFAGMTEIEGEVTKLSYLPPRSHTSFIGAPTAMPLQTHQPEEWNVTIQQNGRSHTFPVDRVRWRTLQKGDHLTFSGGKLIHVR